MLHQIQSMKADDFGMMVLGMRPGDPIVYPSHFPLGQGPDLWKDVDVGHSSFPKLNSMDHSSRSRGAKGVMAPLGPD